jgi:hypothetical protein
VGVERVPAGELRVDAYRETVGSGVYSTIVVEGLGRRLLVSLRHFRRR